LGRERVILDDFEQNLGVVARLQQAGQRRLADADDAFDGDVLVVHGKIQNKKPQITQITQIESFNLRNLRNLRFISLYGANSARSMST
jgi:hypothetical protein